jgi:Arc/MetJ-type ribon-helix-helix transcriptional regulator
MVRTTVYLPEELKEELERVAERAGRSEAELIREGVRSVVAAHRGRAPRIPLFSSDDPDLAARADEHLAGFGQR